METVEILPRQELVQKLKRSFDTGNPLVVKAGFDPSAPDLHVGSHGVNPKDETVSGFGSHGRFFNW